jgi:hypothetical protein
MIENDRVTGRRGIERLEPDRVVVYQPQIIKVR